MTSIRIMNSYKMNIQETSNTIKMDINFPALNLTLTDNGNILELQNPLVKEKFCDGVGSNIITVREFNQYFELIGFKVLWVGDKTMIKAGSLSVLIDFGEFMPFSDSTVEQVLYVFDEYSKEAKAKVVAQGEYIKKQMEIINQYDFNKFTIRGVK